MEAPRIEARIVEAVRVREDSVKKGALSKGCELSARWLRIRVIGKTNNQFGKIWNVSRALKLVL